MKKESHLTDVFSQNLWCIFDREYYQPIAANESLIEFKEFSVDL